MMSIFRIWSNKEQPFVITRQTSLNAVELPSADYQVESTVEGILERIDAHGKFQFVIYDVIDERAVKCEVTERQLEQACASFRKRVEVIGMVKYRKDGMPVIVKASKIIPFPSKAEIPSLQQMRKLLEA